MHVLKNAQGNCACQQQTQANPVDVKPDVDGLHSGCCSAVGEQALTSDECCCAAEGSGRVAGAHGASLRVETLELRGVDASSVIATGCCSSPGAEFSAGNKHSERVSRVNLLDQLPSDANGAKRVYHEDAVVADLYFGAPKHEVRSSANQNGGCCGSAKVAPVLRGNHAGEAADGNEVDDCCQNVTASTSKGLAIGHKTILSSNEEGN